MSRWSIKIQSGGGLARIQFLDGIRVVGLVTMPLHQYHEAVRETVMKMTSVAQEVIKGTLEKRLWADAQSMTLGLDADAAIAKMEAFGWTREKIEKYAAELALTLGQALVEALPEHV